MITSIDLAYPEKSAIKYEKRQYPDGQQDIIINTNIPGDKISLAMIKSRFNSFKDLELIICTTKALRRMRVKRIALAIPYLLGARSDRLFQEGGTSYLVDIIAPIINAQGYEIVQVMDVHSYVAEGCISNLWSLSNGGLVKDALEQFFMKREGKDDIGADDVAILAPDAGAYSKIYKLIDEIGFVQEPIICSKHRDIKTGKLDKVSIPETIIGYKNIVIVDDICDGGRTFINIAEAIRREMLTTDMYLVVTHGIFSKGFDELGKYFKGIHCSNSISDIDHKLVTQTNIF